MIFDGTTESLELVTASALSTDWSASYADHTTTTFVPDAAAGNIVTAATTAVVAAPSAATQRQLKYLTVRNRDASQNQTVYLQKNISAVLIRVTPDVVLKPGEVLQYIDGQGFSVLDPFAQRKASGSIAQGVVSDVPASFTDGATESLSITPQGRLRVSSVQADIEKVWQNTTGDPWGSLNNQWDLAGESLHV